MKWFADVSALCALPRGQDELSRKCEGRMVDPQRLLAEGGAALAVPRICWWAQFGSARISVTHNWVVELGELGAAAPRARPSLRR